VRPRYVRHPKARSVSYGLHDHRHLITSTEAARRLGRTRHSLAMARHRGTLPIPYHRIGRRIMYDERDIADYIEQQRVEPVADKGKR